jgi:capsular polysaccharide biosynthesis protein
MDLLEYRRVVRRQLLIVLIGLSITFALMFFALVRVSSEGMVFRQPPIYQARSELLVTRAGFTLGRAAPPDYQQADDARMEYLAGLYAELATSEAVRTEIARDGSKGPLPRASYDVTQLITPITQRSLPLIEVVGLSTSAGGAIAIANRVAEGLRRYILVGQDRGRVAKPERVDLRIVTRADHAEVLQGVKVTTAIMVFILGLVATLAVAFARDNMRRNRGGPGSGAPALDHPAGAPVELEPVPPEEISVPRRVG